MPAPIAISRRGPNDVTRPPTHPAAARAHELHAERSRILCRLGTVPIEDLRRLADILAALSDDDIRQVARFAESLALWPEEAEGSDNGQAEAQDFGG